jgi:hypothetical protein
MIVDSCWGVCPFVATAEAIIEGYWGIIGVFLCPMDGKFERAAASVISGE